MDVKLPMRRSYIVFALIILSSANSHNTIAIVGDNIWRSRTNIPTVQYLSNSAAVTGKFYNDLVYQTLSTTGKVSTIDFSPNGQYLASGSIDENGNGLQIWDTSDWINTPIFTGLSGIHAAEFSPDGQYLAFTSGETTVQIWRMNDWTHQFTLTHPEPVVTLAFSPNGQYLVCSYSRGTGPLAGNLKIWQTSDWVPIKTLTMIRDLNRVTSLAFSSNSQYLASGCRGGTIWIWETNNWDTLKILEHGYLNKAIAFSPDGQYLACAGSNDTFRIFRINDWVLIQTIKISDVYGIDAVTFSPDGLYLAYEDDRNVQILRTDNWTPVKTLSGHTDTVMALAYSPDNQFIASGSHDSTIRIWKVSDIIKSDDGLYDFEDPSIDSYYYSTNLNELGYNANCLSCNIRYDKVIALAFSPNGQYLATSVYFDNDPFIHIWNFQSRSLIKTITILGVTSIVFSPDGQYFVAGINDGRAIIWNTYDWTLIRIITSPNYEIKTIKFSPDGQYLVSGGSYAINVWNTQNWIHIKQLEGISNVFGLAFSPDGRYLASGGESGLDGMVQIWETNDWSLIHSINPWQRFVSSVSFSPDGRYLAAANWDGTIQIWDTQDWIPIQNLNAYMNWIQSIIYSPDGRYFVSGNSFQRNGCVQVWDTQDWTYSQTILSKTEVNAIAVTPDGRYLAAGGNFFEYDSIQIWDTHDWDCDGLLNTDEVNIYGTDPFVFDTDNDGLSDGVEVNDYNSNQTITDSDGDVLTDDYEIEQGLNPLVNESDQGMYGIVDTFLTIIMGLIILYIFYFPRRLIEPQPTEIDTQVEIDKHYPLRIDSDIHRPMGVTILTALFVFNGIMGVLSGSLTGFIQGIIWIIVASAIWQLKKSGYQGSLAILLIGFISILLISFGIIFILSFIIQVVIIYYLTRPEIREVFGVSGFWN